MSGDSEVEGPQGYNKEMESPEYKEGSSYLGDSWVIRFVSESLALQIGTKHTRQQAEGLNARMR